MSDLFDNSKSKDYSKKKKSNQPDFVNRDEGVAAWINEDRNDDEYISVKLPLGLGTLNLFQNKNKQG